MKTRTKALEFKGLVKKFKKDKVKNANVIVDILEHINKEETKRKTLTAAITSTFKVFNHLLVCQDLVGKDSSLPEDLQSAQDKYKIWLREQYADAWQRLLSLLQISGDLGGVREVALTCLLKLLQTEARNPLIRQQGKRFPVIRHQLLISGLLNSDEDQAGLIKRLSECFEHLDFSSHTMQVLAESINEQTEENAEESRGMYLCNLFNFLELLTFPLPEDLKSADKLFIQPKEDGEEGAATGTVNWKYPYKRVKRNLNSVWSWILKQDLSPALYRRALILLPDKVMQHLDEPVMLTDFFMTSYNFGGGISLLAMQGVFILIQKYNLDYPDFYKKLYALFEPNIFNAKYRPRFFMLANIFLSSTHLPEYLAAAFVKRLSRLLLVAPAPCQVLLLQFICNLLLRHPNLHYLVHNPTPQTELTGRDPYDPSEPDPSKCRASESSLWEVVTLQQHVLPEVARAACFINVKLPKLEHDISLRVEDTYEEMAEKAKKLKAKEVSTNFEKPHGFFGGSNSILGQHWQAC